MSFNDIQPRRGSAAARRDSATAGTGGGSYGEGLAGELQEYQKQSMKLKERVTELRRMSRSRGVTLVQKDEVDQSIKELRQMETRVKNMIDVQQRGLELLPRMEIAQKRIALGKLSKDFERVRGVVQPVFNEAATLKVVSSGGDGGGDDSVFRMAKSGGSSNSSKNKQHRHGQELQFELQIQGQAVDDLIAEERERDIKKMNQDLQLVNEMFKDMAEIVEKQNPHIEQVAESTEKSHERAKAGLEQVEQAAAHQGGCVIA